MIRIPAGARAPEPLRGSAVALGNLDGVHRGHQALLAAVAASRRPLTAAVFAPHPRRFFAPDAPPFRLQTDNQRARALGDAGVEAVFEIAFSRTLAALSDAQFCQAILVEQLGASVVGVGADFRYGHDRMGDASSLAQHAAALGFQVVVVAPVDDPAGGKISSTAIRAHVAAGRMDAAARLLGRPWAIEGTVVKGAQRGRTIGMPTANVALGDYVRPAFGVYAAQCNVGDGVWRPGVANIGVKPTVGAAPEPLLEVHLFDYADDLYGRGIEVRLHLFLRAERRFESFEALTRQIAEDAAAARRHFGV